MPLRYIDNPNFRCLYLRRQAAYLGEAIDKSEKLYPKLGGVLLRTPRIIWTFPSGATIWFNHCDHDKDVRNYDSFEFHMVLFDELTHFTEAQYRGIRARIRGTDATLPRQSRAASNPGGEGHDWVFKRFGPWLNPDEPIRAEPGQKLWFHGDLVVPRGTPHALSRTFIPARLEDNPHIEGDYRAQLIDLSATRRAQLEKGDWLKRDAPKDYWDRAWVAHRDHPLADATQRGRFWDLAATVDGDWTVGGLMATNAFGTIAVEHVVRFRGAPEKVHAVFKGVAEADLKADRRSFQSMPTDPGQAGKDQLRTFQMENPGVPIFSRPNTGDKLVRFGPASSYARSGRLVVVRGPWNGEFHDELEAKPGGKHDDQMDIVSDGTATLSGATPLDRPRMVTASRAQNGW